MQNAERAVWVLRNKFSQCMRIILGLSAVAEVHSPCQWLGGEIIGPSIYDGDRIARKT